MSVPELIIQNREIHHDLLSGTEKEKMGPKINIRNSDLGSHQLVGKKKFSDMLNLRQ
jgi:hypothetical protein